MKTCGLTLSKPIRKKLKSKRLQNQVKGNRSEKKLLFLSQNFRIRFLELFGFEFPSVKSEQEPRWEKVPKGEEVKHMYLDPRNQIQGGFGGVKRVDFGQREKRIADLKKQLDKGRVKIGRITKWTVRILIR